MIALTFIKRPISLAMRLILSIGLATIIVFISFGALIVRSVNMHFLEQDAGELQMIIDQIKVMPTPQCAYQIMMDHSKILIHLTDNQNNLIYTNMPPNLIQAGMDLSVHPELKPIFLQTWIDQQKIQGDTTYRLINLQLKQYHLIMAISIDFHMNYLRDFILILWLLTFVACLILIITVYLAIYQGHAPLRQMSIQIQNISSDNLHIRLNTDHIPIELQQVSTAFNHMIEKIDDVFQRQSHFSADIAHEMRTPITNLATQTQIALRQTRSIAEYQEVLYSNLEEYDYMAKMIRDLLFLAQADNQLLIPETKSLNISQEIKAIFEYFEAWTEERQLQLEFKGDCHLTIQADQAMLRRALTNLLSNAIRHTPTQNTIFVHALLKNNLIEIIIDNPGSKIPDEHLPKLFDRFYRADPSRQKKGEEGAGIGLAIVKSIITAHQGKICVHSDEFSTRFIITLPSSSNHP